MTWIEAEEKVKKLANGLHIYWGTGYPIYKPHVIAYKKDAWSGEGMGYNVMIYNYPDGASYGNVPEFYSVSL